MAFKTNKTHAEIDLIGSKGKKKPRPQELKVDPRRKVLRSQAVFPHLERDGGHHGLAAGEVGGDVPADQ